jgi:hypothetical protein
MQTKEDEYHCSRAIIGLRKYWIPRTIYRANVHKKCFYPAIFLLTFPSTSHFKNYSIFLDIMPFTLLKVNQCFRRTYSLHLLGWRVSPVAKHQVAGSKQNLALALMMEVTCSSEMSVDLQETIWYYIPDNGNINNHCRENPKSYTTSLISWFPEAFAQHLTVWCSLLFWWSTYSPIIMFLY